MGELGHISLQKDTSNSNKQLIVESGTAYTSGEYVSYTSATITLSKIKNILGVSIDNMFYYDSYAPRPTPTVSQVYLSDIGTNSFTVYAGNDQSYKFHWTAIGTE